MKWHVFLQIICNEKRKGLRDGISFHCSCCSQWKLSRFDFKMCAEVKKNRMSLFYMTTIICYFCQRINHFYTGHSAMHGGVVWWAVIDDSCQIKRWSCKAVCSLLLILQVTCSFLQVVT